MELVAWRTKYYRLIFAAILDALGVSAGKVYFVDGSSYELSREFMIDSCQWSLKATSSRVVVHDEGERERRRAGSAL